MIKKFNVEDWDVEPIRDESNDGMIYGNYVNWDDFREENEESLLSDFGVDIPWGEELRFDEYTDFLLNEVFVNTTIVEDLELNRLKVKVNNDNTDVGEPKITIVFPERSEAWSNLLVSELLDYFGVPSGMDWEDELPESLRYWSNNTDFDYDFYTNYPLKLHVYEETIENLRIDIQNTVEELTKKSLLLAALIITESFYKSIIISKMPDEIKNFLDGQIEKLMKTSDGRDKMFEAVFKRKAPKQYWKELRNVLAHDINTVQIKDSKIIYPDFNQNPKTTKKKQDNRISTNKLFQQLQVFTNEIKSII